MRNIWVAGLLAGAILVLTSASAPERFMPAGELEVFRQALGQAGLDESVLAMDTGDRSFYGGDRYRLEFFDALMSEPLKIPAYTEQLGSTFLRYTSDLPAMLTSLQQRTGNGVRIGLVGNPLAEYEAQVKAAGDDALAEATGALEGRGRPVRGAGYEDVPAEVRDAAALVLFALADALKYRHAAVDDSLMRRDIDPDGASRIMLAGAVAGEEDEAQPLVEELAQLQLTEDLMDTVDYGLLNTGAALLLTALQQAADDLSGTRDSYRQSDFRYEVDTRYGRVVLSDRSHDTHMAEGHCLLLIDVDGDDRYTAAGFSTGSKHPAGLVLDLAGDDTYDSSAPGLPSFGAGVFGYGMLLDGGGDDEYNGIHLSQGAGLFGVGVLADLAGEDTYTVETLGQGSGSYGTGLLVDVAGPDLYRCYQTSQGYGFTMGAGLLLDAAGDDFYDADDSDIRYPSAQSAEHNASLSQGFGFGRRGDYLDGHSWAGGVGLLIDGAGSDYYKCGVFGQGSAYWYGTGMLIDRAGSDTYEGQWYAQATGAHFALGILNDHGGNDTYTGYRNMCTGAGHDFSLGWLEEGGGNDRYSCPNLSLGGGNANGIGVFRDHGGDDRYTSRGTTLGRAAGVSPESLRRMILTIGLFIDMGGSDEYRERTADGTAPWEGITNAAAWVQDGGDGGAAVVGCGIDTE